MTLGHRIPIALRVAGLLLPKEVREEVLGDLHEAWLARARTWSRWALTRWAWRQPFAALRVRITASPQRWGRRSLVQRGSRFAVSIREDLRAGFRSLRRAPAFTGASVLILGLGIGTAAAMFAAFHAIMIQDLPVTDADGIVSVSFEGRFDGAGEMSSKEVDELGRASATLQAVAGVGSAGAEAIPLSEGDRPLVLNMSWVTPGFFQVLGVRPILGRLFRSEDGEEGALPVAILSYRAWQRDFGGDPDVLSRELTTTHNQVHHAIVGIAPPGLDFPVGVDYWMPAARGLQVVARLAPGATSEAAESEALSIAQAVDQQRSYPQSISGASVRPLSVAMFGDSRPVMLAVVAAVALLLLIVCVNVGNLNLMRATRRSRDVMVRRALGASSGRVVRLFLVEGALLSAVGGAAGLLFAVALLRVMSALAPARLPRADMIGLVGTPIRATVLVTVLTVLISGVLPAYAATCGAPASDLRTGGRSATGTVRRRRVRRTLVAAQLGLAVILLVGAGLLARSLQQLSHLHVGYDLDDVAIVELGVSRASREGPTGTVSGTIAMLEGVLGRLRAIPGVTSATPLMSRPYLGWTSIFRTRPLLEGQSEVEAESNELLPVEVGGSELFRTMGIPVVRGRGLSDTDTEDAPRVVVVSEAVARNLWPGEDPIGKRIRVLSNDKTLATVVGVAGDTRFRWLRQSTPTIYMHWRQFQALPGVWTVAIRTRDDLASMGPSISPAIRNFDQRIQVWRYGTLREYLDRGPLAQPRTTASLISGFGLASLLLAAVGLYGVMALAVRERTHELGIRTALGATSSRLRLQVLAEALKIGVAGISVGLIGAMVLSRGLSAILFQVGPEDPLTFSSVCAVLLVVSVLAAYVPAVRATRVDPRRALAAD